MSDESMVIVMTACFVCGQPFTFNPNWVPSVPIDPRTGRPLDVGADGKPQPVEPGAEERAVKQPLCESCVELINENRRRIGEPEIVVHPDAYEAIPPSEL